MTSRTPYMQIKSPEIAYEYKYYVSRIIGAINPNANLKDYEEDINEIYAIEEKLEKVKEWVLFKPHLLLTFF